jgi:hypothetical protein
MSLAPIPERGRSSQLLPPDNSRARSISPSQANKLRRNSVHHTDIGFEIKLHVSTYLQRW